MVCKMNNAFSECVSELKHIGTLYSKALLSISRLTWNDTTPRENNNPDPFNIEHRKLLFTVSFAHEYQPGSAKAKMCFL